MHLWYEQRVGYPIRAYASLEDAIRTWPTTATAIGVRRGETLQVCAPFGLEDLFGLVVRPNKKQIAREIYMDKGRRWKAAWRRLTVVPWD